MSPDELKSLKNRVEYFITRYDKKIEKKGKPT